MEQIWSMLVEYLSIPYFLTFLLLSYLVKRYFQAFLNRITRFVWRGVYTVLILATIVAVPFIIWGDVPWNKIVFSYALGTSLHELIFKWIGKLFTKK
jgi:hypothetical protein